MSNCEPCNNSYLKVYPTPYTIINTVGDCGCVSKSDATCVSYTGPKLTCTNIEAGTNLEDILLNFDAKFCTLLDDYGDYDMHCLSDEENITNEAEFVSAITLYACDTRSQFTTYKDITIPNIIQGLEDEISTLNIPNITTLCSYIGLVPADSQKQVLTKLGVAICDLDQRLTLSPTIIDWDKCYTVLSNPTNLSEAFNLLIDQICLAKGDCADSTTDLPKFDNTGSCLATPTVNDTLVDTVQKIKVRLCQSPTYDIDLSPWGCIVNPDPNGGASLQTAFDEVLERTNGLVANRYVFDNNQFNIDQTTSGDTCSGYTISLKSSGGTGTLSSVGLTAPTDIFTVGNSPLTANGNIALSLKTQAEHTMLLGPQSGSGIPTFRKLVTEDLDNNLVTLSKIEQAAPKTLLGSLTGDIQTIYIGTNLEIDNQGYLNSTSASGGTLSSVGLDLPTELFDVMNTPLTADGIIQAEFQDKTQGMFFASPPTTIGKPYFRKLMATDITDGLIPLSKLSTLNSNVLIGSVNGSVQEITIGNNLSLSAGGILSSTNTSTTYTGSTSIVLSTTSFQRAALTGDVTSPQNSNTLTIAPQAVTYSKIQDVPSKVLLGRGSLGSGSVQNVTIGANLALSDSGVLSATGGITPPLDPLWDNVWKPFSVASGTGTEGLNILSWLAQTNNDTPFPNLAIVEEGLQYKIDLVGNFYAVGSVTVIVNYDSITTDNFEAQFKVDLNITGVTGLKDVMGLCHSGNTLVPIVHKETLTPITCNVYLNYNKATQTFSLLGSLKSTATVPDTFATPLDGFYTSLIIPVGGVVIPLG